MLEEELKVRLNHRRRGSLHFGLEPWLCREAAVRSSRSRASANLLGVHSKETSANRASLARLVGASIQI